MFLIQCVNAYASALAMSQREVDYKLAYALVMLKRELKPQADFFVSEEAKLVEEYAAKDEKGRVVFNERGNFTFADPAKAKEYAARREALGMVEAQERFTVRTASAPKTISAAQLEALEGFIRFEEEEASV